MLKILWPISEFGGLRKHKISQQCTKNIQDLLKNRAQHPTKSDQPINPLVLAQHEHPERLEGGKAGNLVNLVVVEVEEDEAPERGQVLYACDGIVLVVQQPQLVLTLQDGAHSQLPPKHNSNIGVVHEHVPER